MGLEDIGVYISRRQNMVSQYIVTCPIMDLCLAAERKPGMRLSRRWWEQPSLDILGIRVSHDAAKGGVGQGRKNHRERESRGGEDDRELMI